MRVSIHQTRRDQSPSGIDEASAGTYGHGVPDIFKTSHSSHASLNNRDSPSGNGAEILHLLTHMRTTVRPCQRHQFRCIVNQEIGFLIHESLKITHELPTPLPGLSEQSDSLREFPP
jgi:hypothetical protein